MATTFPGTHLSITVELYNITGAGTWINVSSYVLYRDKVFIHQGLTPQDTGHSTSSDYCYVTFKNIDKRFSPHNILGPYYGYLGINTPIRIKWNAGNGDKTQFEGMVPNWNPKIPTDDVRNVRIQAFDRKQQLVTGTGRKIQFSPIYTSTIKSSSLVTFMPLEDNERTKLPTLINGKSVATNGVINYAADDTLPGAKALPSLTGNSYIIMNVREGFTFNGHWQFDFFYRLDNYPTADTILFRCWVGNTGTSGIAFWDIIMKTGTYQVVAYDRNGVAKVDSGSVINSGWIIDTWMHHRLMVKNASSTTFDWQLVSFLYDTTNGFFIHGEGLTGQCGNLGSIFLLPNAEKDGDSTGEWAVYDAFGLSTVDQSGDGYAGEPPGTRWSRLLNEQGVPNVRRVPGWSDTVSMGRQPKDGDLVANLEECLVANEGYQDSAPSTSDTDAGGLLRFTERGFFENRTVGLTLTYSNGVLYALEPNDDDFAIVNDFTATRNEGSSARVVQTRGPKNINSRQADRYGVGSYATGYSLSLATDQQALDHAGWQVNKGTVDAMRVVNCEIWFERKDVIAANVLATFEALDTWSRVKIVSPPTDFGPDPLDFFIAGMDKEFDQTTLHVKIYGPPASTHDVGILDSTGGATSDQRLDSNDTRTLNSNTNSETAIQVWNEGIEFTPTKWAHDTGDYKVRIDGEEMLVTAVADVAASFVGVGTGGVSNNANIVGLNIHASSAKNDCMVAVVYSRNTAAIVGITGAGWNQTDDNTFTNFRVFAKAHSGSEAGPTATVTGGAAGDDLIAQIATFRGIAARRLNMASLSNSSAQNINAPAVASNRINALFLIIGGKPDDWTSVATVSGFTEIAEVLSTGGNDAGLVWDYLFATTGTAIGTNTFTVTGGTSQTSQAIAIALDCNIQQLTVTRGSNNGGTGIAHPINQEVHVTNPIILGI